MPAPAIGLCDGPCDAPCSGTLAGLKVVELAQLIAGPFAARTLADFGAEVVKVEPPATATATATATASATATATRPGGDPLRQWRLLHAGTSVWWQVQSRNERSLAPDLKDPAARDLVRQLIAGADVLVENFKPGVIEDWGLGYEALSAANPGRVPVRVGVGR